MKFLSAFFLFFCTVFATFAQTTKSPNGGSTYVPLNDDMYRLIDRYALKYADSVPELHTSIKPYLRKTVAKLAEKALRDSANLSAADRFNLTYLLQDNWNYLPEPEVNLIPVSDTTVMIGQTPQYVVGPNFNTSRKPILKHFYKNKTDFYHVETEDFSLRVNPVIHFQGGFDTDSSGFRYVNTRGLQVEGTIDRKLSFYTFLADNQARFPEYVNDRIARDTIVPHEGYWKNFKENGYDFFTARGYINYALSKHINVQFGHDKNFIGNGYRSLILSDYAPAYFFLKLNTQVWKLQYENIFASMNADHSIGDRLYPKKYFAYHHLSYNIKPNLNVGVFESVVFARGKGNFELEYLNPIIFYRSVEQQLGSDDNALLGLDFKWNIRRRVQLYGQLVLDEFLLSAIKARNGWWANKQGGQFGAKYIDAFGLKNLDLQGEFNYLRPYLYQHESRFTNYQHYQQPLAHPMGANLSELIGIATYQPIGKLAITGKAIYTYFGADTDTLNWGGNVLKPYVPHPQDYGNKVGQGNTTQQLHLDLTVSYQLKPNMFIDLKQILRHTDAELNQFDNNSAFSSISFRWNIGQRLHEF
ncbi:capsule assembly Wzi family protein [Adhaeribacter soli]|uniref:Capsule assembly Wzi family protein n=1 Tax=Adhaeribacter soli TaxID=2607655 RepID=A0A5N1IHV5_9BACT|nr:capsule assembly Wzi family protein [Adhaeribacter soli]KAA9324968.1 capsule assembly Wzi family protein [Adhaeribacter soli]